MIHSLLCFRLSCQLIEKRPSMKFTALKSICDTLFVCTIAFPITQAPLRFQFIRTIAFPITQAPLRFQSLRSWCFQGGISSILVTVFLLVPSFFVFLLLVGYFFFWFSVFFPADQRSHWKVALKRSRKYSLCHSSLFVLPMWRPSVKSSIAPPCVHRWSHR